MKKLFSKVEIKWAAIFVFVAFLWMYFEKAMGWHEAPGIANHATYTNLFAIFAIIVFVFAILEKRTVIYNGEMTWMEGFLSGLGISIIVAVLSPLTQYITSEFITPNYFENAIEFAVEELDKERSEMESFFSLNNYIKMSATGAIISGIVTSAIVALIFRTKK